jgi:PAS domain S-box-containing protein
MANLINGILAKASPFDATKRIVRPNGEVRYIRCVGAPVVENQSVKKCVGSAIDVTEHELLTQELRRREAYLAEAQRLSHTGSFGWKSDTGEIIWSDETYRIFGYDRSVRPTIDSVVQRVHPQDRTEFQRVVDAASWGPTDFEHTYRLLLPDGRVKHVHALAHALRNASGNREFVGAVTDITERKTAEEALRNSKAYLAEAQRLSHTGSWAWSPDTDIRHWSEECYRVLGFDPRDGAPRLEELIQRIHPDDQPAFRESAERAMHNQFDEELDYRIVHPDGAVRNIHSIGHPVFSPSGDLIVYTGSVIDITERKRAEEALQSLSRDLQESKSKLEEAQRITHVGYWEWDILTGRVNWSDETYRIYGLQPQERPMDLAAVREKVHPDDWEGVLRALEEALSGGARYDAECRVFRPTGEVRIIDSQGDVKRDTWGRPTLMFGTVQDITDRKRAEEALQQSESYLAEGQRLAHMGSWAFNATGFSYWSSELFRVYGLDPSGKPPTVEEYLALVYPEDRAFMKQGIAKMLDDHLAFDFTKRIVRPDGEIRRIRCVGVPVTQEGTFQGFLGTGMDVTEQDC